MAAAAAEQHLGSRVAVMEADIESIRSDIRDLKDRTQNQSREITQLHEEKVEIKVYIKGIHESIGDLRDKYQCWQETHAACQSEKIRILTESAKKGNGTLTELAQATSILNQGWFKILLEVLKVALVVAGVKLVDGV